MRNLTRVQPKAAAKKSKQTRKAVGSKRRKRDEDGDRDFGALVPVAGTAPRDAKWRIEQNVAGVGWCFDSYARSEEERKQRVANIRAFGGYPRAVELRLQPEPRTASDADELFIGDEVRASAGGSKGGFRIARASGGREVAVKLPAQITVVPRVVEVELVRSEAELRVLQTQAAHWLRCAEDAGCRVELSPALWEQVLEASKKSMRSRPRAFEQALNRQPKSS